MPNHPSHTKCFAHRAGIIKTCASSLPVLVQVPRKSAPVPCDSASVPRLGRSWHALRRSWAQLGAPNWPPTATCTPFGFPNWSPNVIWSRFSAVLGASKGLFSRCRHTLTLAYANFLEEDATYEKHEKTIGFYRFFALLHLRARFEDHRKIASNALLERVTPLRSLEKRDFRVSERQNGSRGLSGVPWKATWGSSGTLLAANFALLARSWALLAALGSLLGRSWALLGLNLEPHGRLLGSTWSLLRVSSVQLGRSWGASGCLLGLLGLQMALNGLQVASKWPPSGLQVASKWSPSELQVLCTKCPPSGLQVFSK